MDEARKSSKAKAKRVGPLRAIRRAARGLWTRLLLRAAHWPLVPSLYYFLCDRSFDREHRAALLGKLRHHTNAPAKTLPQHYTLRRNVHRIEKGLLMRPRRPVFAETYIKETVTLFAQCAPAAPGLPLMEWARDVLHEYFTATDGAPEVAGYRAIFDQAVAACCTAPPTQQVPYARNLTPLRITYDDMLALAQRRRSVRWYEQRPVPREIIDRAVTVAGLAPSACNRQPFEFRIFDDRERVQEIAKIPMGTAGFSENFPCLVVLVGHMSAFEYERDRHLIYIDGSLASMSFQFALEVQGIASCSINWPDFRRTERKMAKALNLRPDERVVMLISLGYPDPQGMVAYSRKKSLDELRSYNT